MINTPEKQLDHSASEISPALQFLIFLALFLGIMIVGNVIGAAIITGVYGLKTLNALGSLNAATPHLVPSLWIFQVCGTTIPIITAPVVFGYFIVKNPEAYFKAGFRFSWLLPLLILAIMLLSAPVIEFLSNINQQMVLPPFLKWMRESEDSAQKIAALMLQMNNFWEMLVDVLFIGLITAIVEEFMFRGVMQTILTRWTGNSHVAIWITAMLFSAFHFEFFGFLPRLFLGALFGYFIVWSGSIWTAVWGHFINNGTAVLLTYLYQNKLTRLNPDDEHVFDYKGYIISALIVLFLLFIYKKVTSPKKQIPVF